MTYSLYADIMLLWNTVVNGIVLLLASKILGKNIRVLRLIIWSVLTGVITEVEYIVTLRQNMYLHHILYALLYTIMISLYFQESDKKKILQQIIAVLVSMLLIFGTIGIWGFYPRITLVPLVILFGILLTFFMDKYRENKKGSESNRHRIILRLGSKTVNCQGYIDSGNLLYDSFSGQPVIILDYRVMNGLLDRAEYKEILHYHNTGSFNFEQWIGIPRIHFYPLPYKTISQDLAIMPAFKLTSLYFTGSGTMYKKVVAAISRYKIDEKNNFQVLLNESLKPNRKEHSND